MPSRVRQYGTTVPPALRTPGGVVVEATMTESREAPVSGVGDTLKAYVLHELDVAGRMLGRNGTELHAGIHEARKAIRHVRAALRLGRKSLGGGAARALDDLGELGESLSAVRDANVIVQTLETLVTKTAQRKQRALLRRLCRTFADRRAMQLARLLEDDPAMARRRARLRELRDATASLAWTGLSPRRVQSELARTMRRAERVSKRAHDLRDGELRHRWRRRLRRLRHQLKIAEGELGWLLSTRASWSWPDPTAGDEGVVLVAVRPETLRAITDRLGYEHDLRVLSLALRKAVGIDAADRSAARKIVRKAIAAALK
jgi:CHAD domain-containing protein